MRTIQGEDVVRVTVGWHDEDKKKLRFLVTGPRGGTRVGFIVRVRDLLNELHCLGVWGIGIPVKKTIDLGIPCKRCGGTDGWRCECAKVTVKITKCTSPYSWYANSIGETFEVYDSGRDYTVVEDYDIGHSVGWRHIDKGDCVEVESDD